MAYNDIDEMEGLMISNVLEGSIGEEVGLEEGDRILSINGKNVKDILEYNFLISEEELNVEVVTKQGYRCTLEIEKEYDEELGIEFENDLLEDAKSCTNKCLFCFIDQLPSGMRDSLYFKDDDTRLSFLHGSFVTLTNLKKADLDRIIAYRISPINVSVHTTNPELRVKMLCNKFAGEILNQIKYLTENGITINCQIVLCPDINDGHELERTVKDLAELYPGVHSVAVVPVGLTAYRDKLPYIKPFDCASSKKVLSEIHKFQEKLQQAIYTRFIYPADEFYIMAGEHIPSRDYYEDFPQIENGVGLLASFEEEFENNLVYTESEELIREKLKDIKSSCSIATGVLAYDFMCELVDKAKSVYSNINVNTYKIVNNHFGKNITVSGLLTGKDLVEQLKGKELGSKLLISKSMLKQDEDVFLDDYTIRDVETELNIKVVPIGDGGQLFFEIIK